MRIGPAAAFVRASVRLLFSSRLRLPEAQVGGLSDSDHQNHCLETFRVDFDT